MNRDFADSYFFQLSKSPDFSTLDYEYETTDTTFYVLAVYFGSVGIRHTRHAVTCGLAADLAGIIASIVICYLFFG